MDLMELLPYDIVFNHIFIHLDFTSRVRAAAVNRAWRDLSRSAQPLTSLPWLWIPDREFSRADEGLVRSSLFNLDSHTTYHSRCRILDSEDGQFHCARGDGPYLTLTVPAPELKFKNKMVHAIYNPFSGKVFQLPRKVLIDDDEGETYPTNRIFLTQLSGKPPNCLIAAICSQKLYICRPNSKNWMILQGAGTTCYHEPYDMIFYKGELYCILDGMIVAYNIQQIYDNKSFSSAPWRTVLFFNGGLKLAGVDLSLVKTHYLVDSGGELLMVTRYVPALNSRLIRFVVHRLDHETRGREAMVRMNDLGDDRMLFLGMGCSQSWCRPKENLVEQSEFFTRNCIYFLTSTLPVHLAKYHLGEKNYENYGSRKFELQLYKHGYDFAMKSQVFKYMHSGYQAAVWISPTLNVAITRGKEKHGRRVSSSGS